MQTSIWTPAGYQYREVVKVRKAVQDYDANLDFGKNEKTGDWCVFLRHGTMAGSSDGDLPILGFGDTIPHPDDAVKKLYKSDALRRGHEILNEINRHNDAIHAAAEAKTVEAEKQLAEAFEWGFRSMGKTEHKKVIFRDKGAT